MALLAAAVVLVVVLVGWGLSVRWPFSKEASTATCSSVRSRLGAAAVRVSVDNNSGGVKDFTVTVGLFHGGERFDVEEVFVQAVVPGVPGEGSAISRFADIGGMSCQVLRIEEL